jgi:hypothetical protein
MRLDSSGNLGLGVTPSAWGADYKAFQTGGSYASFAGDSSNGYVEVLNNCYASAANTFRYIASLSATRYSQQLGVHKWFTAGAGTGGNTISFTQAMTLDASGNLGVGTTSPAKRLHVAYNTSSDYTTFRISNSGSTANIDMGVGGSGVGGALANNAYIYNTGNSALVFGTNDTERARIDSSGNLLVGRTTTANTTVGSGLYSSGLIAACRSESTNGATNFDLYSTGASDYRFYVGMGGTIYATSIVISAISDQRLKENVRDIDTGLDAIMALKPRRFDWKEGKGQDKKDVAGFIAQEFEDVFPECVSTSKAGADGIEYKNINHETLIPTLVKAMQEQQAIIESLKARLDAANL